MLIHGDGNSNIKFKSCFECKTFIKEANPDIVLMNPPYNAKPIGIPEKYKKNWGKAKDGKEDPTKGLVFIHFLSDVIKEMNAEREKNNQPVKTVKLAVLLPVSAAIGTSSVVAEEKKTMLKNNTLDAVFTLPIQVRQCLPAVCFSHWGNRMSRQMENHEQHFLDIIKKMDLRKRNILDE